MMQENNFFVGTFLHDCLARFHQADPTKYTHEFFKAWSRDPMLSSFLGYRSGSISSNYMMQKPLCLYLEHSSLHA